MHRRTQPAEGEIEVALRYGNNCIGGSAEGLLAGGPDCFASFFICGGHGVEWMSVIRSGIHREVGRMWEPKGEVIEAG